jgi:hypothetical protein
MADPLDRWLDVAMSEYAEASTTLGFEARVIARLRGEKPRRVRVWAAAFAAAAAMVVAATLGIRATQVHEMPVPRIAESFVVPRIEKVTVRSPERQQRVVNTQTASTRGVPIVATPITRQEEAVLRVVRNARAKQMASLAVPLKEFTGESTPLEIQDLNIPTIFGEERK